MTAITLNLHSIIDLTDEHFYQLCQRNPDIKLERSAKGELIIMLPTGGESGDTPPLNAERVITRAS